MNRDFCGSKSIGTNCETTNIPDLFNIKGLVNNIYNNDHNSNDILSSYQIFNVNKYIYVSLNHYLFFIP
jgi:hypothetical protein